jgi:hypothetical protein
MTDITSREWTLESWRNSVESQPHLLKAKLSPITNFIKDEKAREGIRTASCVFIAFNALTVILEEIEFKTSRIPDDNDEILGPFWDLQDKAKAYIERLTDIGSIRKHNALCLKVLDGFSDEAKTLLDSISKSWAHSFLSALALQCTRSSAHLLFSALSLQCTHSSAHSLFSALTLQRNRFSAHSLFSALAL